MGSATPSMQALHMAAKDKANLLSLNERHAEAQLPQVQIVDLTQYKGAMKGPFSIPLYASIKR
jgi:primosomal protein N' (replication factor Y)